MKWAIKQKETIVKLAYIAVDNAKSSIERFNGIYASSIIKYVEQQVSSNIVKNTYDNIGDMSKELFKITKSDNLDDIKSMAKDSNVSDNLKISIFLLIYQMNDRIDVLDEFDIQKSLRDEIIEQSVTSLKEVLDIISLTVFYNNQMKTEIKKSKIA